jgi:predicted ATPase
MTVSFDEPIDWWLCLRHGGQLIDRAHLDALPEHQPLPWNLPETLRAAVIALPNEGAARGDELTTLMDLLLEQVAGLESGWLKGSQVGPDYRETLLDGTRWKPRRVWNGPGGGSLYVFTTAVRQVGLHKGRRPVAQITEYLRRRQAPLGLLTNGRQWRLIYTDADTRAWVEWDTSDFFSAGQISNSVAGFSRLLGRQALVRADGAERSPLLAAISETRQGQARLSSELGERVRKAVEALLVSRRPVLEEAWDDLDAQTVYVAACHFVMRLVVTLFAEARSMLPQQNPVYHHAYGLTGLLESLDRVSRLRRRSRHSAWSQLLALFSLLYEGSPHPAITLPAYGGDLFRPGREDGDAVQRALHLLESMQSPPDDEVIHQILVMLTRTTVRVRDGRAWRRVTEPVNFTDLSSEYIGILYEGLLDYELQKAGDDAVLFLNLGDQPALPISRLEAMDDKAIKALVEKVKDTKGLVLAEEDGEGVDVEEHVDRDNDNGAPEPATATDPVGDDEELDSDVDDLREAALQRAMAWALRAVKVGKLVKKGRGKDQLEQQQRAADALISDLKLPGELYLVRWGGTRKGSGTFYTRPQLTMPTVRRTLQPLTHAETEGGREPCTPEEILQLKVVDPAMGSASFLVAALRVLTSAVIEGAYTHGRVHSDGNRTRVDIATLAESDRVFPFAADDPRFDEDFEDCIKRYVVEHCLYGVDINPLAVELARVALWVETLDDKLPFTFLDHKLKAGNSLVGCWIDRFREYPLLAWMRDSPDYKYKGVNHESGRWHKALGAKKKKVITAQAKILQDAVSGQMPMALEGNGEALRKDIETVRELFAKLRRIPANRPDRRARLYRQQIEHHPAIDRLRTAFDIWTALWFWPLDELDAAPGPRTLHAPSAEAVAIARKMARTPALRFFHWELEYPDVFHKHGAGFDAVVGNPPWEIQKPSSKEYFSNLDPLYRSYGKQEALRRQRAIFEDQPEEEERWLGYVADYKARGNFVRYAGEPFGDGKVAGHGGGDVSLARGKANEPLHERWRKQRRGHRGFADPGHPFRHQGSADLNTYKMFVEVGRALLREGGELGLIVPSGIYTDKGTGDLRRLLLERSRWRWLFGFENRRKVFDIDSRFKFCILIAQKGGNTEGIQAAFMRHDLEDWGRADGAEYVLEYPAEQVKAFSPGSLSILEIRSDRDLKVLRKIYDNGVLLGDEGADGWGINYATEFHMTNDSKLFPPRDKWEANGYRPDEYGRWIGPGGDAALPLYEGRMIGQFDFSEKGWVGGRGRSAEWREIPWEEKVVEPQYLMAESDWRAALAKGKEDLSVFPGTKLTFMAIGSATNQRSMFSALVRDVPCGNAVPVLQTPTGEAGALSMAAAMNSLAYDFALRMRLGGLNLNYFVIAETPLLAKASANTQMPVVAGRLAFAHHWFSPNWLAIKDASDNKGPYEQWAVTGHERLRLRAILDAVVAALYGLDRNDYAWLVHDCDHPSELLSNRDFTRTLDPKGFWRVDKDKPTELRHTVLSLVAFDALQECINAAGGDRDAGIRAFTTQSDGDGWLLPETLRLADHDLGHDERAREPQPVASVLGPRFLDWQLEQTPEEAWAECERHARALGVASPPTQRAPAQKPPPTAHPLPEQGEKKKSERAMITELRIKNFKAWDESHWQPGIRLAQISMVLGTNSSGKSSLLEPLRLLKQTLDSRDESTQLNLTAPLDLGSFGELVHGRDKDAHLAIGLDLVADGRQTAVDGEFHLIAGIPGAWALRYGLEQREVKVDRVEPTMAYRLSTPDANHPNWDGEDLADPTKNAKEAFRPTRGFELSDEAVAVLGQPLRDLVTQAMGDLHDMMARFHFLGPIRPGPGREIRWEQRESTVLGETGAEAAQVLLSETRRPAAQRTILNSVSRWLKQMDMADRLEVRRIGKSILYELRVVRGNDSSNIVDVGIGVSQVLPVIVLMHFVPRGSVLLLDEPTVHLHPLAQASLADMIVEVAVERDLQVLIETHSEHLFRRVQFLVADEKLPRKDCALYYIERDLPAANLVELNMDQFGRIENWPEHLFGDAVGETGRQMRRMVERLQEEKT